MSFFDIHDPRADIAPARESEDVHLAAVSIPRAVQQWPAAPDDTETDVVPDIEAGDVP